MNPVSTLYIALSTGQNIANLLPILELAQGQDRVLWIESATALRRGWSAGALAVLGRHHGPPVERVTLGDDESASVYRALCAHPLVKGAARRCLVLNGGTKPQMIAAHAALGAGESELAYNLEAPCGLERSPRGPMEIATRQPYRRHRVDLADILDCGVRSMARGERIWPDGAGEPVTRYGNDADRTAGMHSAWHRHQRRREAQERIARETRDEADGPLRQPKGTTQVPYADAAELVPERAGRFRRSIGSGREVGGTLAAQVYASAHGLARDAQIALIGRGMEPPPPLGDEFEVAVRRRVLAWLDAEPGYAAIVQSVWRNVHVRREGSAAEVAEIDCALVLKNGVVLNLECKSFDAGLKDLNSRLAELQRAASRPAEMAVCAPLLTGFADREWFPRMARNAAKIRDWGHFKFLPFTLPGQPAEYAEEGRRVVAVGTFEQALGQWLNRYVSTTG